MTEQTSGSGGAAASSDDTHSTGPQSKGPQSKGPQSTGTQSTGTQSAGTQSPGSSGNRRKGDKPAAANPYPPAAAISGQTADGQLSSWDRSPLHAADGTIGLAELFAKSSSSGTLTEFLTLVIPQVLKVFGGHCGGLVNGHGGRWNPEAWTGEALALPIDLISDAVDRGETRSNTHGWLAMPLTTLVQDADRPVGNLRGSVEMPAKFRSSAWVFRIDPPDDDRTASRLPHQMLAKAGELLTDALLKIDAAQSQHRRIDQLTKMLTASAAWSRLTNDDDLLHAIADAACEILGCQRASIFLWDRRRGKLIGRPALGIDGGVLEVADDAGVVGEVLATNQPCLWTAGADSESRINRTVDLKEQFETRSLLAVPMIGSRDQTIGVFEAINHRRGEFDAADTLALCDLALHAAVAIERLRTEVSLTQSRDRLINDVASSVKLIGRHPSLEAVRRNAAKVAKTELTVLILGKNGTGKEVLARNIHYDSPRRGGPFVAVNCAALVESLLESELFGHEKGAFTDAQSTRVGKFELANGGTLFLDEVGDMSPGGQAKLLRVLEEKVVVRVGGSQPIPVDVRVIAATNQPLETLIAQKRFREDLFFRLNVVSLMLPSLAERGDDVLVLADHFMQQFCYDIGRSDLKLGDAAKKALIDHTWPGNVRELRNTIERVCYLCTDPIVTPDDLMLRPAASAAVRSPADGSPAATGPARPWPSTTMSTELTDATREFQVVHIQRAIASTDGNMTAAAERLGLHRSNLYRKMRQLGMPTSGE